MACPRECSAVQSEMFIVRPAIMLPQDIADRAAASAPSRYAATSPGVIIRIASSAMPSPIGVRHLATIPAIACASASMPVFAVIDRRHAVGHERIDERVLGPKVRVRDTGLATRVRIRDDGATGYLRAGARARGNGDQRDVRDRVRRCRGQELTEADAQLGAQPRGLRRVDDRAAADGHDRLRLRIGERRGGRIDHVDRRLGGRLVEPCHGEPLDEARLGEQCRDGRVVDLDALVDHEEHPRGTHLGKDGRQGARHSIPNRILTGRWLPNAGIGFTS